MDTHRIPATADYIETPVKVGVIYPSLSAQCQYAPSAINRWDSSGQHERALRSTKGIVRSVIDYQVREQCLVGCCMMCCSVLLGATHGGFACQRVAVSIWVVFQRCATDYKQDNAEERGVVGRRTAATGCAPGRNKNSLEDEE
jgi:hypothetical protein